MNESARQRRDSRSGASPGVVGERSFPLVALLQLATFWAAMVACIDGTKLRVVLDEAADAPAPAALILLTAGSASGLLGLTVGLGQLRMWRNAVAGGIIGVFYGLAILAVYLAPAPMIRAAAAAAVLLVTTIAFRIRSA